MIKFLSPEIRTEFHLLPLDKQRELIIAAEDFEKNGKTVTVVYVERFDDGTSEMAIRIDHEFNDPIVS